ncbi:MAG: Crp/Fnr family transcriptional regulator [Hydrogenophaga sp.]|nr:Crp/Fnr family transcriptional regulator [Hydrogenophaga sp.]
MGCLTNESRSLLTPCVTESRFVKGDCLLREGSVAQHLSIVKLGAVLISRQCEDGHDHPVALVGRGMTLGEYAVYGHDEQISASALSAGRICRLEVTDFYRLGVVDRRFHACVQDRIVRSHGRLADWSRVMRIKGVKQRLLATLQLYAREQGGGTIRLPSHMALASLLSTTRESIGRSLRQLEISGHIVRHDRWHCEVPGTGLGATRVAGRRRKTPPGNCPLVEAGLRPSR